MAAHRVLAIPELCKSILLALDTRDILRASLGSRGFKTAFVEFRAELSGSLFMKPKTSSEDDPFYEFDLHATTLSQISRRESYETGLVDIVTVEKAIINKLVFEKDGENTMQMPERFLQEVESVTLRNFPAPLPAEASCRAMFLTQPPVTNAAFSIDSEGRHEVENSEGLRFGDILDEFEEVAPVGSTIEDLQIELYGAFELTREEQTLLDRQGIVTYEQDIYGELQPAERKTSELGDDEDLGDADDADARDGGDDTLMGVNGEIEDDGPPRKKARTSF